MKKIIFAMLLLWSLPAMAQIKSATLTASGLTCSMCSKAIYKALTKLPAVQKVDADVETSTFSVVFKENTHVELDDIKKAVQNAGFSVASMQITAAFNNVEISNDAHISLGGSTFHFLNVSKQTLQGDKTLIVLDKNYLSPAGRKEYAQYTKMKCFETGVMASCCPGKNSTSNRIYHVTL